MSAIPKIIIDQQLAEIGVRVTPAKIHIRSPRPEMNILTEDAEMQIERKAPSFKINRKKINAESGLKSNGELILDYRDKSKNSAFEYIGNASDEGEFLGDTTQPGNRVALLAKERNMKESLEKELNIGLMPKSMPEIVWDPGFVRVNWSKHSIVIEWEGEYMPELTVDPKCSVEVYLRNKPYFRITVVDDGDPFTVGGQVNEAL